MMNIIRHLSVTACTDTERHHSHGTVLPFFSVRFVRIFCGRRLNHHSQRVLPSLNLHTLLGKKLRRVCTLCADESDNALTNEMPIGLT